VIASVRGPVLAADGERAVIAVGGLGLEILGAGPTLSALSRQVGEEVQLHTYLHVREDALQLFGFRSLRERAFFLALIGVSGVGPKVALAVLSGYPVAELETAIALDDVKKFESIPGIGKRLAQRLVIELKDKVGAPGLAAGGEAVAGAGPGADAVLQARSALQNLGLSLREAEDALKGAPGDAGLQDLLKHALAQKRSE
jgi:Holliday junction DNA helicase RuvA